MVVLNFQRSLPGTEEASIIMSLLGLGEGWNVPVVVLGEDGELKIRQRKVIENVQELVQAIIASLCSWEFWPQELKDRWNRLWLRAEEDGVVLDDLLDILEIVFSKDPILLGLCTDDLLLQMLTDLGILYTFNSAAQYVLPVLRNSSDWKGLGVLLSQMRWCGERLP